MMISPWMKKIELRKYLSSFKYYKRHAWRRAERNPYSFTLRWENLKERLLGGFIEGLHPYFSGESALHPTDETIPGSHQTTHPLTCEWDLHQDSISMLGNDFLTTLKGLLPLRVREKLAHAWYHLFIYLGFDGTDESPVSLKMPVNSGFFDEPSRFRIFWSDHRYIKRKVMEWKSVAVSKGSPRLLVWDDKVRSMVARMIETARFAIRFMIRLPVFVKNLPLLFSNKRN